MLESLAQIHLENAKLLSSRDDILPRLPKQSVVAEIGVAFGDFSRKIFDYVEPLEFHAFDLFTIHEFETIWGRPTADLLGKKDHLAFFQERFSNEIRQGRLHLHVGDSSTLLRKAANHFFDVIYLDGDHTPSGVQKDVDVATMKIKRDGLLIFNDYIIYDRHSKFEYGVVEAVNDLCVNHGWEIVYYALHPELFCDVALRRR